MNIKLSGSDRHIDTDFDHEISIDSTSAPGYQFGSPQLMNLCSQKDRHAAVLRGGWVGKRLINWKWISPTKKERFYQFWLSHEFQFLLRWKKSETDKTNLVFVEFGEFPACKDGFCFLNKSVTPVFVTSTAV